MSDRRRARDLELLDTLDTFERIPLDQTVWRVVREGRDPLLCHNSAGRWDPGHFEVLYTALHPDGALTELNFHLARQPVFPSRAVFQLHELRVTTRATLKLANMDRLEALGIDARSYSGMSYERTQEIGDAAAFLGFDSLLAPSARWDGLNLTAFCDSLPSGGLRLEATKTVDWEEWRRRQG